MLKGCVINESRVMDTNENYLSLVESVNNINIKIDSMDNRIVKLEDKINSKDNIILERLKVNKKARVILLLIIKLVSFLNAY